MKGMSGILVILLVVGGLGTLIYAFLNAKGASASQEHQNNKIINPNSSSNPNNSSNSNISSDSDGGIGSDLSTIWNWLNNTIPTNDIVSQ